MKIYAKDLKNYYGKEITFSAVVDNIRDLQWVQFVILRDSTGKVQVTIEKSEEKNKDMVELISSLPLESTVKVTGTLMESPKVKLNGMEIIPNTIEVTSKSELELPFNYKNLDGVNLDTRLDNRFIDLRSDKNVLLFKIESALVKYMREYLYNNDFTEIHTPKLIGAASESGSEVFEVKYFDGSAYLAQSPQFYKQMAISSGFDKVFEVGPVFRAENSNTSRHATEFTSFDVEFAYIDSFKDVMKFEEEMIKYAFNKIHEEYFDQVKEVFDIELPNINYEFPILSLKDAYDELEKEYDFSVEESEKNDLTTEAERLIGRLAKEKYGSEFVFITDYPAEKRAFYHMRDENGVLQGYDLIWRGVEITTGAEREHRYEEVVKNAKEKGLENDVKFYLDFFKYGCPPHGGFGLGIDRLMMLLLDISTVKEVQFLFRGPNRINP